MARTKYVHKEAMVAHLWAHQSQEHARSVGSRLYFGGKTAPDRFETPRAIYSYGRHYMAAMIQETPGGDRVALVNGYNYSITTRKHLGLIEGALRGVMPFYTVENPAADSKPLHKRNVAAMDKDLAAAVKKYLAKTGGRWAEGWGAIESQAQARNEYARAFRLGLKPYALPVDELKAKAATLSAKAERWEKERAEKENARRIAARDKILAQLAEYGADYSTPEALEAARMLWRKGELKLGGKVPNMALIVWACENREVAHPEPMPGGEYWYSGPVMLYREGEECVTTKGARVPLEHAHRIFRMWARLQGKVPPEGWVNHGDSQEGRVGHFRVDHISPEGVIKAGCHTIQPEEVRAFGVAMGWAE